MNTNNEMTEKNSSLSFNVNLDNNIIDSDTYLNNILSKLQEILDKRFSNNVVKRKLQVMHNRISFACPYCGDSQKSDYKKRGSIILDGKFKNFFKCHNCGEFKRIDKFFSDYDKDLGYQEIEYVLNNIKDFSYFSDFKYDISLFLDMDNIEEIAIDRNIFKKTFNLKEVLGTPLEKILKNRVQYDYNKFLYNPTGNGYLILNITPNKNILGMQIRQFKGGFKTYPIRKLYNILKLDENSLPEKIDDISQIFNICLIDYQKPVTVFEGPMDSFLYKNAVGIGGANKHFPIDMPLRYFFDYDKTGKEKSIEYIQKGNSVFLWERFLKDYELPFRKKWDLNDVYIYFKERNQKIPIFEQYFSNNIYDIMDI